MPAELIFDVTTVSYAVHKGNPPKLLIQAEGVVNSTGWTMPKLEITSLQDGVLTYEFKAEKPTGVVLWVMTKIHAEAIYEGDISKIDAIKVMGAEGDIAQVKLGENDKRDGNTTPSTTDGDASSIAFPVVTRFRQREKVSDLIGLKIRILKEGSQATFDLRSDRINIFVDKEQRIEKIWFS